MMFASRFGPLLGLLILPLVASGCLFAAKKIVTYEVRPDGSGTGKIIYTDIASLQEDDHDRSLEDYTALVNEWLYGSQIENRFTGILNPQKRLFVLGDALHGEVVFDFQHYSDVGLYRHNNQGPWMFYAARYSSNVEGFDTANGSFGGDVMPVVFWPEKTTSFRIVNGFNPNERPTVSLLPLYKRVGVTEVEADDS